MQIHELPAASPSGSDYIAIDDGDATRKATLSAIDMAPNQVTFTSGDSSSPSSWQTVAVLASNTLSTLMGAISKMVANVRWLYNRLGTSSMGTTATTVTGAVAELNTQVNDNTDSINALNSKLTYSLVQGSGTSAVTIPTGWKEATIHVLIDANATRVFTFHVTSNLLTAGTAYSLRNGYYQGTGNYAFVQVSCLNNSSGSCAVAIQNAVLTGTEYASSSYIKVAYR